MAKKKKFRITKNQRTQLVASCVVVMSLTLGFIAGHFINKLSTARQPKNLVWASESGLKVPPDLNSFLLGQKPCHNSGPGQTTIGVGLWAVYAVSHNEFAKVAYGCLVTLTSYVVAIKLNNSWQLILPAEYFAPFKDTDGQRSGALPFCTVLQKYKIPKDIESFCVASDGTAKSIDL